RPIKGTAARHADDAEDRRRAGALLASTKDRAELLMITDLLRNDLGKVCAPGSVRVPALRTLESFPHLHHLVSTIRGTLAPSLDVFDALAAVFPCGSITGAPKRRAMEILRDLEPAPRGIYTGAVGWIGFDRSASFRVAIRTGEHRDGVFSFGAGGGIVIDSTADAEWRELLLKTRAFARALGVEPELLPQESRG
ncbi:anthranilate synthase component I family protein, partial [bacterium]|nr:anthranilate synthase component I family protein [bacterium]